jgi:hypothetical protein
MAIKDINLLEELAITALNNSYGISQENLASDGWKIIDDKTKRVIEVLNASVLTLEKYVGGRFSMGTKTGLNDAFVIDEITRIRLIAEDKNSAEIIKPLLRGRDVKRWSANWQNLFIIFTHHGIDIAKYPAIEKYLSTFKADLLKRATSSSHEWYELQQPQMGFYRDFESPKIIYLVFQTKPVFALDNHGYYINNAVWMLPKSDWFLLAVLNSNVGWYQITHYCTPIQNGFQLVWDYLKNLKIPTPPDALREQIADLARQCLAAASSAPGSLPALESRLNALVYQAYGLDAADIAVIESAVGGGGASVEVSGDEIEGE